MGVTGGRGPDLGPGEPAGVGDLRGVRGELLVGVGQGMEAEHERAGVRPRLARDVPQFEHSDANFLGDLADHGLLGGLTGLDEAGQAGVAG